MSKFTISVDGLTPEDAVDGILALAARFQGNAPGQVAADVPVAGTRARRGKAAVDSPAAAVEPVSAAAPEGAAGGLPDLGLVPGDAAGSAAVGAAQLGTDAAVEARPEGDGSKGDATAAGASEGEGGAAGGQGAEALPDLAALGAAPDPVDEVGQAAVTLEVVQGLAKALGAKAGIGAVQAVFKAHAVATPADIDPAKLIALKASFDKALAS